MVETNYSNNELVEKMVLAVSTNKKLIQELTKELQKKEEECNTLREKLDNMDSIITWLEDVNNKLLEEEKEYNHLIDTYEEMLNLTESLSENTFKGWRLLSESKGGKING